LTSLLAAAEKRPVAIPAPVEVLVLPSDCSYPLGREQASARSSSSPAGEETLKPSAGQSSE
jgi:hypothetical protein